MTFRLTSRTFALGQQQRQGGGADGTAVNDNDPKLWEGTASIRPIPEIGIARLPSNVPSKCILGDKLKPPLSQSRTGDLVESHFPRKIERLLCDPYLCRNTIVLNDEKRALFVCSCCIFRRKSTCSSCWNGGRGNATSRRSGTSCRSNSRFGKLVDRPHQTEPPLVGS